MGRPRKRRHEETIDTENRDENMEASEAKIVGAADVRLQESDLATLSGDEPGLGTDGFHFSGNRFEGHDALLLGAGNGSNLSNTGAFSFDLPESPAYNPEQGFPDWNPLHDLDQPFPTFADVPLQLPTPPSASDEVDSSNHNAGNAVTGCSCLSNLYLMLAKFQSLPEPSFPFSMGALRSAAAISRGVVTCQDCFQAYNTALQNSMLLGTLLQLVITEYAKLLKHIDERSERAEKIAFRFGNPSSLFDSRHTGLPDCPMAICVDLSGDEWRTLARKAVAQEVLGNSQRSRGLTGLVQEMSDRQASWRDRSSKGQCIAFHSANHRQTAQNPDHLCVHVLYVDHLRRSLEALGL